jgi:hypothetical protein
MSKSLVVTHAIFPVLAENAHPFQDPSLRMIVLSGYLG